MSEDRSAANPAAPGREAEAAAGISSSVFSPIEEAIEEIRRGRMVVVCDDENRENEGDLTMAAQFATPEAINFMAMNGRGLICLSLTGERCDELGLDLMAAKNESPFNTAFTISVEARDGVTTEASVDLARLAGLIPAGVICEIMNEDGTMARVPDLVPYCEEHDLKMITVADLIEYRRRTDKLVERASSVRLPTEYGEFAAVAFREKLTGRHHVALVKGDVRGAEEVLVRVHSECLTGDVFHSLRCDCGEQLEQALTLIGSEERGVLLYMAQEGRGIGLLDKLRAYELP